MHLIALALLLPTLSFYVEAAGGVPARAPSNGGKSPGEHAENPPVIPHYGTGTGSGTSNGGHPWTQDELNERLGHVLEVLSEVIKELVPKLLDDDKSASPTQRATPAGITRGVHSTSRPTRQISSSSISITGDASGDATGCLSAQSVYASATNAWSDLDKGRNAMDMLASPRGQFDEAPAKTQASYLCYTSIENASSSSYLPTRYDGWVSQCNDYLKTGLPSTTTVSNNLSTATLTATQVQSQLERAMNQCSGAGDVRATTSTPTTMPTVQPPTTDAAVGKASVRWTMLALAGLVQCLFIYM